MKHNQTRLPSPAIEFLRTHPQYRHASLLRAFHHFLTNWKIGFKDLKRAHIESFIQCPRKKILSAKSRRNCRWKLSKYLNWLHKKGLLGFDPQYSFGRPELPLPPTAVRYIHFLEPTRKKSTISGYRVSLRNFHHFLDDRGVTLETLSRDNINAWLRHLNDSKPAPKTMNHHIIYIRSYLRWLYDEGTISGYPDHLLRTEDIVKEPKYLPRPLPPAADNVMQQRLANTDDIYALGLLLMRRTGLRIGELISLKNDCVRSDHLGNRFLKVPLGKLNTERLVPVEDETVELIEKLGESGNDAKTKTYLIETKTGKKTRYVNYVSALKKSCHGLDTGEKMVTHRLRHTYATELLNAGMSLVGVMKLLGHNDHRMTLRYAEITLETASKEYFEALSHIEHRYENIISESMSAETNPIKMLDNVVHLILNWSLDDNSVKTVSRTIVKRLQRIQREIHNLFPHKLGR